MKSQEINIELAGGVVIVGTLSMPTAARGIVIFAHGSGSSRFSRRNIAVASELQSAGFATLLLDLFTAAEEGFDDVSGELRFDISLLAERVIAAIVWMKTVVGLSAAPIGLFGASTGAAAALVAAAARKADVKAVVSRGGRPDLAGDILASVRAPTLLIVGGLDTKVISLNQHALQQLAGIKELVVVPRASHLFEEPGALGQVAVLARHWFERFLVLEPVLVASS